MNIFFLHWHPRICALFHCNKHVIKMILESVQLLASAHWMTNSKYKPTYKLTHKNHPCSKWVRESLSNYQWLVLLTIELCKEYTFRYGKVHKCQHENMIKDLKNNLPDIPDIGITMPALAMPDDYKISDNPIVCYRLYYNMDKKSLHNWKKRSIPNWIIKIK